MDTSSGTGLTGNCFSLNTAMAFLGNLYPWMPSKGASSSKYQTQNRIRCTARSPGWASSSRPPQATEAR